MKILINTATTFKGGGIQVAISILNELKKNTQNEYHVILGKNLKNKVDLLSFPENFTFSNINYRPAEKIFSPFYNDSYLLKIEKNFKPDVVFTTSGPSYANFSAPHLVGFNLPHYIYKESPFIRNQSFFKKIKLNLKGILIKFFYKRDSDAILCQTEDVSYRASNWLKINQTYTVSNTYNSIFNDKALYNNENKYFDILILSSYYKHKNIEIINDIINELTDTELTYHKIRFITTIEQHIYERIFTNRSKLHIKNLGPVKINDVPEIYNNAKIVFQPSLLECFSANYVEAMVMRKPILCANLPFSKTICKDAALYYEPMNAKDALKKILILKSNKKIYKNLIIVGKKMIKNFPSAEDRVVMIIKF